jgi:hypothetical protein
LSASETDATRIVRLAWLRLPPAHRSLLEAVGASQWQIVNGPIGSIADDMLRSAGQPGLCPPARSRLDGALGAWVPGLQVLLINVGHAAVAGLDTKAYEAFVAHIAWHEWGHALSLARCSSDDVAAGDKLLASAPKGISEGIRSAGYGANNYTHEVVAETYALMMARRIRGHRDKPTWLDDKIYNLLKRVTGWVD